MSDFPSQNQDKFVLRLPDGMRDRIKSVAQHNNRSMNAEIVATLEEKYPEPELDMLTYLLGIGDMPARLDQQAIVNYLRSRLGSKLSHRSDESLMDIVHVIRSIGVSKGDGADAAAILSALEKKAAHEKPD